MNNNTFDNICKKVAKKNNMTYVETEYIINQYIIHQRDAMLKDTPKVMIKGIGNFIKLKDGKEYYEELVAKRKIRQERKAAKQQSSDKEQ